MKYQLTDNIIRIDDKTLHQIQALNSMNVRVGDQSLVVRAGDLGGFVESENNLDQDSEAWIYPEAMVFDHAWVTGHAKILGRSQLSGDCVIRESAHIIDSTVTDGVVVFGSVKLVNCALSGCAWFSGRGVYRDQSFSGFRFYSDRKEFLLLKKKVMANLAFYQYVDAEHQAEIAEAIIHDLNDFLHDYYEKEIDWQTLGELKTIFRQVKMVDEQFFNYRDQDGYFTFQRFCMLKHIPRDFEDWLDLLCAHPEDLMAVMPIDWTASDFLMWHCLNTADMVKSRRIDRFLDQLLSSNNWSGKLRYRPDNALLLDYRARVQRYEGHLGGELSYNYDSTVALTRKRLIQNALPDAQVLSNFMLQMAQDPEGLQRSIHLENREINYLNTAPYSREPLDVEVSEQAYAEAECDITAHETVYEAGSSYDDLSQYNLGDEPVDELHRFTEQPNEFTLERSADKDVDQPVTAIQFPDFQDEDPLFSELGSLTPEGDLLERHGQEGGYSVFGNAALDLHAEREFHQKSYIESEKTLSAFKKESKLSIKAVSQKLVNIKEFFEREF